MSHPIKGLRRVGIIRTERLGQNIACWVDPDLQCACIGWAAREAVRRSMLQAAGFEAIRIDLCKESRALIKT